MRRLMSAFLSCFIALSLVPVSAFADYSEVPVWKDTEIITGGPSEYDGIDQDDLAYLNLFELAKINSDRSVLLMSTGEDAMAGARLSGNDRAVYDALVGKINQVARGELTNTEFVFTSAGLGIRQLWTAAKLGVPAILENGAISEDAVQAIKEHLDFNGGRVIDALMADYPYQMYWYDKTIGSIFSYQYDFSYDEKSNALSCADTQIVVTLAVAEAYAGETVIMREGNTYRVELEADKLDLYHVQTAVDNARRIVKENEGKSNYEKLLAYKNIICELVSYDDDALDDNASIPYGNPWQLISVFDGDPATNVVCEGYAKAFQFLCDLSEFDGDVQCFSASGTMSNDAGPVEHMWNVVQMQNARIYLVDITNCDEGAIGAPDKLFLAGVDSSISGTDFYSLIGVDYICRVSGSEYDIAYTYNDETRARGIMSQLIMSETSYVYDDNNPAIIGQGNCGDADNPGGEASLTWTLDSNGLLKISGAGKMKMNVPWYGTRGSIVTVVLENGVTSISDSAFQECSNMKRIVLPDSLENIGYLAFGDCCSLTDVVIPESVTSIEGFSFKGCSALTEITIPDSVNNIGWLAFDGCTNLSAFNVGEGNNSYSSLDGVLFNKHQTEVIAYPARKPDNSYTIPDSVNKIIEEAFWDCSNLSSITIASSVEEIYGNVFANSVSLTEINVNAANQAYYSIDGVLFSKDINYPDKADLIAYPPAKKETSYTIPDDIVYIGAYAFAGCANLSSVIIPNSVQGAGDYVFWSCTNLASVTIPDRLAGVTYHMFMDCENLSEVNLPESIKFIGDEAFMNCSSLKKITIPDSVASIGTKAFEGCASLINVSVPNSVSSIGDSVFSDCNSLASVTLSDQVKSITDGMFSGCTKLSSVIIPDSVTTIGRSAFFDCSSLIAVNIPDGVTSIGSAAFYGCSSLTNMIIPDGVTSIGEQAFWECEDLISVTFPDGIDCINYGTFYDCTCLTNVTIKESNHPKIASIGDFAFYNCSRLKSLSLPDSITRIGDSSFWLCTNLLSVTLPDGVTSIGYAAFYYCSNLVNFTIPMHTTSIGDAAFAGCSSLTSAVLPAGITMIGIGLFNECNELKSVTIPNSVTSIGYAAFYGCDTLQDVYFGGSKEEWKSISIDSGNDKLTEAAIHYNIITSIFSASADGGVVTAMFSCASDMSANAVSAMYDKNGKMLSCDTQPLTSGSEEILTFLVDQDDVARVKLFMLDGQQVPLCTSYELELN